MLRRLRTLLYTTCFDTSFDSRASVVNHRSIVSVSDCPSVAATNCAVVAALDCALSVESDGAAVVCVLTPTAGTRGFFLPLFLVSRRHTDAGQDGETLFFSWFWFFLYSLSLALSLFSYLFLLFLKRLVKEFSDFVVVLLDRSHKLLLLRLFC